MLLIFKMSEIFKLPRPGDAFENPVELGKDARGPEMIPELEVLAKVGEGSYQSLFNSRMEANEPRPDTLSGYVIVLNSAPDRSHMLVMGGNYSSDQCAGEGFALNFWRATKNAKVGSLYLALKGQSTPEDTKLMKLVSDGFLELSGGKATVRTVNADDYAPEVMGSILAKYAPQLKITDIEVMKGHVNRTPTVRLVYNAEEPPQAEHARRF